MMLEVIIYFVIAAVVVTMLYMVLGKQVGEAPDAGINDPMFKDPRTSKDAPKALPPSKHFTGPAGDGLQEIASADASFDPEGFLDGAKSAYNIILEAYADGDLETLETLLSAPMYEAYAASIAEREEKGLTQTTDLARLLRSNFTSAGRNGKTGYISVEYEADIAAALMDASGDVVEGDIDTLSRVTEVWTYERTLGSKNPDWHLISVEEAGEDTPGSAPDFTPDD